MTNQKWKTISAIVTQDQENDLRSRASNSGMTLNEYIKARLFIDDIEDIQEYKTDKFDKWLIKALASLLGLSEALANKSLTLEENEEVKRRIADIIKRSNFLKEEEIFKNNS